MDANISKIKRAIEGQFKGVEIFTMGERGGKIEVIDSGLFGINWITGIGGYPRGRIIEIFSPESVGKTTLCLSSIAKMQKKGVSCIVSDVEGTIESTYARKLGCDLDNLLIHQPATAEETLKFVTAVIQKVNPKVPTVIFIDSIAAMTPEVELAGKSGGIALHPRIMSENLRKISSVIKGSGAVLICLNQMREKPGILYGNPETTPGGRALRHYTSLRIEMKKGGWLTQEKQRVGFEVKLRCIKNKVSVPFRICVMDFHYNKGFDNVKTIISCAIKMEIIKKKRIDGKSVYAFGDIALGSRLGGILPALKKKREVFRAIKKAVEGS